MEKELIRLYSEEGYSINKICKKYRIGKLKVKKILSDNNIPLKKKGAQKRFSYKEIDYNKFNKKWLKCKKTGKVIKDTLNRSGSVTNYLKEQFGIEMDSPYIRKRKGLTEGKLWYEDYFILIDEVIKDKWGCPCCNYTTNDVNNLGGFITKHVKEHGFKNIRDFFEKYPQSRINLKEEKIDLNNPKTYVTCKICGEPFRSISNTHLKSHNITIEEYKNTYGEVFSELFLDECSVYLDNGRELIENNFISKAQQEINDYIESLGFETIVNHKKILEGIEIDIYIPSLKVGFEYNGLFWHSERMGKDKNYHITKQEKAFDKGVKLYHIFSDEWINTEEIVKSKIRHLLGVSGNSIYARKCIIKEINSKDKGDFLKKYHIQGNDKSSIKLGLYYQNELVSVMTFSKPRRALGSKDEQGSYELVRYSSNNVVGGASKLLKYFIKKYNPKKIFSYADRRWTLNKNNLYTKIGFEITSEGKPNYWYCVRDNKRLHRYNFRKDKLVKEGYDKSKTENQIMLEIGYDKVWDCGNYKYELNLS